MAYRTIGKTLPRIEGEGKVTGQTKYAADLPFENLLWAKILRASAPHARIIRIDTSKAKALKGVREAGLDAAMISEAREPFVCAVTQGGSFRKPFGRKCLARRRAGAACRTRTSDPRITNAMLYQLS